MNIWFWERLPSGNKDSKHFIVVKCLGILLRDVTHKLGICLPFQWAYFYSEGTDSFLSPVLINRLFHLSMLSRSYKLKWGQKQLSFMGVLLQIVIFGKQYRPISCHILWHLIWIYPFCHILFFHQSLIVEVRSVLWQESKFTKRFLTCRNSLPLKNRKRRNRKGQDL